jgi:molybdopterin-guanine dinucleotide biosynthesis protein A
VQLPFTAALLAGGKSRRMGRDKAFLPVEREGKSVPLWDRQLSVLKAVAPAELVISGPRKKGYSGSIPVYADEWRGVGPLGGIATCLKRINNGLLLVLAIDLPHVQPSFLQGLLAGTEANCGIVPILNNHFEPLIAIYPKAALELAVAQLRKRDYVLQHFVALLLEHRLVTGYEVETSEQYQLENWNRPEDLSNPQ